MKRFFASDFFYDFVRSPVALVSFLIVLFLILSAVFAGVIAPTNPFDAASLNLMNGFTPPMEPNLFTGDVFWMGTDDQGRVQTRAAIVVQRQRPKSRVHRLKKWAVIRQ